MTIHQNGWFFNSLLVGLCRILTGYLKSIAYALRLGQLRTKQIFIKLNPNISAWITMYGPDYELFLSLFGLFLHDWSFILDFNL